MDGKRRPGVARNGWPSAGHPGPAHYGVGWVAVDTGVSKVKTCTVLHFYAGSSTYDTQEMGRLIDCLVNMAREQGVALESDEYIDALVAEWEGVKED